MKKQFKEGDKLTWKRHDVIMSGFEVKKSSNDGKLYINNGYGTMVELTEIIQYNPELIESED